MRMHPEKVVSREFFGRRLVKGERLGIGGKGGGIGCFLPLPHHHAATAAAAGGGGLRRFLCQHGIGQHGGIRQAGNGGGIGGCLPGVRCIGLLGHPGVAIGMAGHPVGLSRLCRALYGCLGGLLHSGGLLVENGVRLLGRLGSR